MTDSPPDSGDPRGGTLGPVFSPNTDPRPRRGAWRGETHRDEDTNEQARPAHDHLYFNHTRIFGVGSRRAGVHPRSEPI